VKKREIRKIDVREYTWDMNLIERTINVNLLVEDVEILLLLEKQLF
jgi:hypothetical protein